ncbi:MAG TPA: mucoidy inhibitor MuiA family protein [Rhodothermales bacterium]|nr:mucoidy inhibitor MuiA family protein [Rhodothermales bacterium]
MKAFLLICLLFQLGSRTYAQVPEKQVSSSVRRATVYRSGARITREARAAIPAGTSSLLFTGLTATLDPQSVQLDAGGDFTVLSVTHRFNYVDESGPSPEVAALTRKKAAKEDSLKLAQAMLQVYQEEEKMLLSNRSIGGTSGIQTAALKDAVIFFRERLTDMKTRQLETRQEISRLQADVTALDRQINEVQTNRRQNTSSEVLVTVAAPAPTHGSFALSYMTPASRWTPHYDLRVADVGAPIAWDYNADVQQSSGEDWHNVRLTLSTGDPTRPGTRPELHPWRIGFLQPRRVIMQEGAAASLAIFGPRVSNPSSVSGTIVDAQTGDPLPGVSVAIDNSNAGTVTDVQGRYTLTIPPGSRTLRVAFIGYASTTAPIASNRIDFRLAPMTVSLNEVVVMGVEASAAADRASGAVPGVATENATTVEFEIAIPYTIPSDGKPNTVKIQEYEVPASYRYFAAPRLDRAAFLTARITGWEKYHLLPAQANVFFGGTYVGEVALDPGRVSDTLVVSLGRDAGISIERTEREDFTKRQFFGSKQTETHAFDIAIRNNKRVPVDIAVQDQVPLSTDEQIDVDADVSDDGILDETTGIVTWRLRLPPGASETTTLRHAVSYPKGRDVAL